MDSLIQVNITAFTRVARATAAAFTRRRYGTLVNVSSALALRVRANAAVYSGTKAYVLQFSRVLQQELADKGVTVQVVLPGAVATDIWATNNIDVSSLPKGTVMSAEELVDAALAGLEQGEFVTLPSLPDVAEWDRFEAARTALAQTSRATTRPWLQGEGNGVKNGDDAIKREAWIVTLAAAAVLMVTMGSRQSLGYSSRRSIPRRAGNHDDQPRARRGQFTWGAIQPIAGAVADRYGPAR